MNHRNSFSPSQYPSPWASEWGEDRHGLWQAFTYQQVRHVFRWIPKGSFMMGSPVEPVEEAGRFNDEDLHPVTISQGFWLAETTVTQALWQAVMYENPSHFMGANRPVEQVSWDDAQVFIERLNSLHPNLTTRLPWEAEWEYACRAGSQAAFNFDGELTLAKVNYRGTWEYLGNFAEGAFQQTAEVKTYPCNDWGLYEMHGNVWEWCQDSWQENLGKEAVCDPWSLPQPRGSARVVRGGSWDYNGGIVRSAIRRRLTPDVHLDCLGFRLALGHSSPGGESRGLAAPGHGRTRRGAAADRGLARLTRDCLR
ncbi:MAG: formylglycine-generating enzyme family protein [Methylomonas sp.]|jgi:formylglycine-generating enzyme required for sulfatase activity